MHLCICFPVWRELKPSWAEAHSANSALCICFPVWRELKPTFQLPPSSYFFLCICFPVWRELKQHHLVALRLLHGVLCICFPVWRELKRSKHQFQTFPITLYMLSRLKGIETLQVGILTDEGKGFVYAFPFEGNWNPTGGLPKHGYTCSLCICFPVWRELKQHWLFTLFLQL